MEDFVEQLARGNVREVKTVLASVVSALAVYQVFLMAVGYGTVKLPFLGSRPASRAHRAVGDTVVVVTLVVAFMCAAYFGWDDGNNGEDFAAVHMVTGVLLLAVLGFKIAVIRWLHGLGRFLPALGISVFVLFTITWVTSAGLYLF